MKVARQSAGVGRRPVSLVNIDQATGVIPSDCHVTSYYKCSGAQNDPWADAYGNGSTCLAAKQNATMAYNQLCYNAGVGTAIFDTTSIECSCD